jgi:formylglycine-generating enzyme required for sulfatase activity
MRWWIGAVTLLATAASAGPKKAADNVGAQLDGGRDVAAALKKAGWVATPEGSDRYQAGFVYDARNGLWSEREGCFKAVPTESIYNELEVAQALQAGAKVPLGVVTAEAEGVRYKKLTYADPRVSEIQGRYLELEEQCRADLEKAAKKEDISSWYVVQAVLLAIVNEQECTEIGAGVKSVLGGAGVEVTEQCATSSVGQVAVAFKTVPVSALLGSLPAEPPAPTSPPSTVVGGASFDTSLSVEAALKEQQCAMEASSAASTARATKVAAAVAAEQATARTAWSTLGPAAEACTAVVDPATRKGCADKVAAFVAQAEALAVDVSAGVEVVSTACGTRQVPLPAARQAVSVPEVTTARAVLGRLQQPSVPVAPSAAPASAPTGQRYDVRGYTMVPIAPGSFDMGCTPGQGDACQRDEQPVRNVTLTSSFWMGRTEVTQGLYRSVTGVNPSGFSSCGDDCPVETVTWCDAIAFANALSVAERLRPAYTVPSGFVAGMSADACNAASPEVVWDRAADGYRLPTDAEWEYAARAGTDLRYSGSSDVGAVGWYLENAKVGYSTETHPTGTKAPNAWGLHDMSGNVSEWVFDWYTEMNFSSRSKDPTGASSGDMRGQRGGCLWESDVMLRVTDRSANSPGKSWRNVGFRLARTAPGPAAP